MRGLVAVASLALTAALVTGCSSGVSVSTASSEASVAAFDESEGKVLADDVASALIAADVEALYDVMNAPFKSQTSPGELEVDSLFTDSGTPAGSEYKWSEAGTVTWPDGSQHAMRKYWYALETDRYESGTYFLFVEVIPEGDGLACNQFSVVSFTSGTPEQLQ